MKHDRLEDDHAMLTKAFACRFIIVANHLPIRASKDPQLKSWSFEWDEDALISQAQVCFHSAWLYNCSVLDP